MDSKRQVPKRPKPGSRAVNALDIVESTADAAFATDENGRIVIWNRAAAALLGRSAGSVLGKPCHEVTCGGDVFGNRFCDEDCSLTRMVRRGEPIRAFPLFMRHAQGQPVSVICSTLTVRGPRASQFSLIHLLQPMGGQGELQSDQLHALLLAGAGLSSSGRPEGRHSGRLPDDGSAGNGPGAPGRGLPPHGKGSEGRLDVSGAGGTGNAELPEGGAAGQVLPRGRGSGGEIPLSTREVEVLKLVSHGSTASQIADALFISATTVRTHIRNILHKLDAHSKVQAVSLALRNRLI